MVADASAVIELLTRSARGRALEGRLVAGETVHVPHLLEVEVLHALRRMLRSDTLDQVRADQAVADLLQLPFIAYPHGALAPRVWELRDNLSAYDATYVALAEALDLPLVTANARIARAPGHRALVELLGG